MLNTKKHDYITWVSKRISDNTYNSDTFKLLLDELTDYASEHNLAIVSHSFTHDCASDYYDWWLTAILE